MKYRVLGLSMAIIMILSALAAAAFDQETGPARVHQHLSARQPDAGCDCSGSELCTHLPLVIIDTSGQQIPGEITDLHDSFGEVYTSLADDGRDVVDAEVSIIDNQDRNNHPSDPATVSTISEIRLRGHSSRTFEKRSYRLNFVDEEGLDNPVAVMGMDAHSDWALYGPSLDKSLIRNYMWYNISGEIMAWAPNVRYCELILNGEYEGLYLMVETITNGNDCRLDLSDQAYGTSVTGYLLRSDRTTDPDLGSIRDVYSYLERMTTIETDISIRYPKRSALTEEIREGIELDYAAFEKALYSYDYDTGKYGYWNWIDEENFIDYFLINEFSMNSDAGKYSTYIYKDMSGKYKLAVWDFNNACDNYQETEFDPDTLIMYGKHWYTMLCKSQRFVDRLLERYEELRDTVFSEEYLMNYIDETLAYLGPAIERNNERWHEVMTQWEPLTPTSRNLYSYEEAVEQLKDWLCDRGDWLDDNIHTLRQYCHPSRNKAYNH